MEKSVLDPQPNHEPAVEIYQLPVLLLKISPAIWRRILVRSDSTIADLHYSLQIALGWTNSHLHQFSLHGQEYGVYQPGGVSFHDDPKKVRLSDLKLRLKERFIYQYDFGDNWRHQIRLEQKLPFNSKKDYPVCIGGARKVPPENCGGPIGFMEIEVSLKLAIRDKKIRLAQIMAKFIKGLDEEKGLAIINKYRPEIKKLLAEIKEAEFDRQAVNQRLKKYTLDDPTWWEGFM